MAPLMLSFQLFMLSGYNFIFTHYSNHSTPITFMSHTTSRGRQTLNKIGLKAHLFYLFKYFWNGRGNHYWLLGYSALQSRSTKALNFLYRLFHACFRFPCCWNSPKVNSRKNTSQTHIIVDEFKCACVWMFLPWRDPQGTVLWSFPGHWWVESPSPSSLAVESHLPWIPCCAMETRCLVLVQSVLNHQGLSAK